MRQASHKLYAFTEQTTEHFTVRFIKERIAGEPGWSFEIRDASRRFRGGGWSRGGKAEAEREARVAIAKLQHITDTRSAS